MSNVHMVLSRQEYMKKYRAAFTEEQKEAHRIRSRKHYHENKEYYLKWQKENVISRLCSHAKQRAKIKGIEYNLDKSLILLPTHCPILGIELEMHQGVGAGGKENSYSLDRKDQSKGYVDGNVWVISHKANSIKFTATREELLRFASWIVVEYT